MCVVPQCHYQRVLVHSGESFRAVEWHTVDGSTHLLQLYQGNQRREMCPPPSPTTGDHLEGQ